jgi:antagonist of KipI
MNSSNGRSKAVGFKVEKPGLLTTVQDLGRTGYRQEGVLVSGAIDAMAHSIANLLVGNPESAPTLEFTLIGPSLRIETDLVFAITGGNFTVQINGTSVSTWRSIAVKKGALLEIKASKSGCRGYLAVAGGMNVPLVLGSSSTYLRANLGGFEGRALQAGDEITYHAPASTHLLLAELQMSSSAFVQAKWYPSPEMLPQYQNEPVIRMLKGPEYEWFTPESQEAFWEQSFSVTTQADRMGYRLTGPALTLKSPKELLSTAVTFGTVQVPAQGQPIVLMADHQTTGGYPRIAQVITADLPILAQVQPGQQLRFQEISLAEAYQLYFRQEQKMNQLKTTIALKTKT